MGGENLDRNDSREQRQKVAGETMQQQKQQQHKGNGDEDGDAFARAVARALKNDSEGDFAGLKKLLKKRKRETRATETERSKHSEREEKKQRGRWTADMIKANSGEQLVREKNLARTATRGVVQIFNAIGKNRREEVAAERENRARKEKKMRDKPTPAGQGKDVLVGTKGAKKADASRNQFLETLRKRAGVKASSWDALNDNYLTGEGKHTGQKGWDRDDNNEANGQEIEDLVGNGDFDDGDGED